MDETTRRRTIQADFNREHGIVPMSIQKDVLRLEYVEAYVEPVQLTLVAEPSAVYEADDGSIEEQIGRLESGNESRSQGIGIRTGRPIRNRIRALKLRELELKPEG